MLKKKKGICRVRTRNAVTMPALKRLCLRVKNARDGKMYVRISQSRQRAVFEREKMASMAGVVITLL